MNAAIKLALVPVEEYLAAEQSSPVKREYVAGAVYPMTGGSNNHCRIIGNVCDALRHTLGDNPCEAFLGDTKIRIRLDEDFCFYYPDVAVVCEQNPGNEHFQDRPVVIVEVLSPSTRRTDDGEKKDHYLTIPSLQYYLLVDQESSNVVLYRRQANGFSREIVSGLDAAVELPKLGVKLPLGRIYHRISFDAE